MKKTSVFQVMLERLEKKLMCLALLNIAIKEGQNLGSLQVHIQPGVCWSLRYKINVI